MMRMSTLFVRTLREDPADAEVRSHRLLVRAGYIRRAAPGGYTWLPLGKLVLDRVTAVVKEEMAAIGAQEVLFPALIPLEPYEATGRATDYGPDMLRLTDRRGAAYAARADPRGDVHAPRAGRARLVPGLPGDRCSRCSGSSATRRGPRAGLLRTRELLMKDSYSFDLDDAGLAASYAQHRRRLPADLRPAGPAPPCR